MTGTHTHTHTQHSSILGQTLINCYHDSQEQLANPVPANSQAPTQKEGNTPNNNASSLCDVFMPKDASDGEMDEFDHELEEFKRFAW